MLLSFLAPTMPKSFCFTRSQQKNLEGQTNKFTEDIENSCCTSLLLKIFMGKSLCVVQFEVQCECYIYLVSAFSKPLVNTGCK